MINAFGLAFDRSWSTSSGSTGPWSPTSTAPRSPSTDGRPPRLPAESRREALRARRNPFPGADLPRDRRAGGRAPRSLDRKKRVRAASNCRAGHVLGFSVRAAGGHRCGTARRRSHGGRCPALPSGHGPSGRRGTRPARKRSGGRRCAGPVAAGGAASCPALRGRSRPGGGQIFVVGGFTPAGDGSSRVDAYSPTTNRWRQAPDLPLRPTIRRRRVPRAPVRRRWVRRQRPAARRGSRAGERALVGAPRHAGEAGRRGRRVRERKALRRRRRCAHRWPPARDEGPPVRPGPSLDAVSRPDPRAPRRNRSQRTPVRGGGPQARLRHEPGNVRGLPARCPPLAAARAGSGQARRHGRSRERAADRLGGWRGSPARFAPFSGTTWWPGAGGACRICRPRATASESWPSAIACTSLRAERSPASPASAERTSF